MGKQITLLFFLFLFWLSIFGNQSKKLTHARSPRRTDKLNFWSAVESEKPLRYLFYFIINIIHTHTNLPLFFLLLSCLSTLRCLEQKKYLTFEHQGEKSPHHMPQVIRVLLLVILQGRILLYDSPKFLLMYCHAKQKCKTSHFLKIWTTRIRRANNLRLYQQFHTSAEQVERL